MIKHNPFRNAFEVPAAKIFEYQRICIEPSPLLTHRKDDQGWTCESPIPRFAALITDSLKVKLPMKGMLTF